MLSKPVQLWLPRIAPELTSRDRWIASDLVEDQTRAYASWKGETTIWLHPGLTHDVRWKQGELYASMATPARHFDCIDVFHVSSAGHVWHPVFAFPALCRTVWTLLRPWVDSVSSGAYRTYLLPESISLQVPLILDDRVTYIEDRIQFEPLADPVPGTRRLPSRFIRWPRQPATLPPPVLTSTDPLPNSDSDQTRDSYRMFSKGVVEMDSVLREIAYLNRWPKPFADVVGISSGLETKIAQAVMQCSAAPRSEDIETALASALTLSRAYISQGTAPLAHVAMAEVQGIPTNDALAVLATKFDLDVQTLDELCEVSRWCELLSIRVPVTRAWGPIGLFWVLVIAELEAGRGPLRQCLHCGLVVKGTAGRQFCRRTDNLKCWRQRNAIHQRESRLRRHRRVRTARHF
jgi:hypothetical protein